MWSSPLPSTIVAPLFNSSTCVEAEDSTRNPLDISESGIIRGLSSPSFIPSTQVASLYVDAGVPSPSPTPLYPQPVLTLTSVYTESLLERDTPPCAPASSKAAVECCCE